MNKKIAVYSFYNFFKLKNRKIIKKKLEILLNKKNIKGTILLASEGVNGSISGKEIEMKNIIPELKQILSIKNLKLKKNYNSYIPFQKLRVRLKKEIVSLGIKNTNVLENTGKYIHPKDWNELILDKKFKIIDTRNHYEINIGSFENSINPRINTFRDFPKTIEKLRINKNQKIAMFCTGGIRCEKASSYLIDQGYKNVYQLEGGILNYFNYCNKNKYMNKWKGECFVFDSRVAVKKDLSIGTYDQCYGCRHPLKSKDKKSNNYKKGIHCPYCFKKRTLEQLKRSTARQKQIENSNKKNIDHPFKKIYESDIS